MIRFAEIVRLTQLHHRPMMAVVMLGLAIGIVLGSSLAAPVRYGVHPLAMEAKPKFAQRRPTRRPSAVPHRTRAAPAVSSQPPWLARQGFFFAFVT